MNHGMRDATAPVAVLAAAALLLGLLGAGAGTGWASPDTRPPGDPDEDGEGVARTEDHEVAPARFDGRDRYDTAALVAEHSFDPAETDAALVARADDFPDALAGTAPAGAEDAPVLLVERDEVPERTDDALRTLEPTRVYVLGGEAAVSEEVVEELRERHDVERIAGDDRYATAAAAARHVAETVGVGILLGQRGAIVASGEDFPDALTAGPLAYSGQLPLLLTRQGGLPDVTRQTLRDLEIEQVAVVGGPAAVSRDVTAEIRDEGIDVERIHGVDRTETARALADRLVDTWGYDVSTTMLATGQRFPDALAAGPRGGELEIPVLLTEDAHTTGPHANVWLADRCPDVTTVQAVGGTAAVSTAALDRALDGAGACHPERRLTYEVGTQGEVHADLERFTQRVHEALTHVAGWPLDGDLEFVEVADGGDLRIWLASPQAVDGAHEVCSAQWSCRVGDDVYINDERWRGSTETYRRAGRTLTDYRWYVTNHEVGHWLGHDDYDCPGTGEPAPVMQQQSISLDGCTTNVWPLQWERDDVRERWLD